MKLYADRVLVFWSYIICRYCRYNMLFNCCICVVIWACAYITWKVIKLICLEVAKQMAVMSQGRTEWMDSTKCLLSRVAGPIH